LFNFFTNPYILDGRQLKKATGLDNLLYTPDADFSCFADLALASPEDYYIEGQGSLLQ
jgi:zeta-carotene desaturase